MFGVLLATAPFDVFHLHLTLAGTSHRFYETVVRAGRADARGALWLANVFAISWTLVVPRLLRTGLERWAPERRQQVGWWRRAPRVAVAAGVFDLIRTVAALTIVGKQAPRSAIAVLVTTAGCSAYVLYGAALVGVFGLVIGPQTAPLIRPAMRSLFGTLDGLAGTHPPDKPSNGVPERTAAIGPSIGIAVSGGGIRAASVALGALRGLDGPRLAAPSLFLRARWISGVSGGAYTAGGWRISRRPGGGIDPPSSATRDFLFDEAGPWATTVHKRHRFLDNGALSIAGGVLNALARTVAVFGALLSFVYVLSWFAGRAVHSRAMHPWFPYADRSFRHHVALRDLVPVRLWLPGGAWCLAAAAVMVVAITRQDHEVRLRARRIAGPLALVGAVLLLFMVLVPIGIVYGRRLLQNLPLVTRPDSGAGVLGILSSIGLVGALTGLLVAQVKRRWLRLGGVALALGMVVFGGKVADATASGRSGFWSSWVVLVVAVVWMMTVDSVASHRLTLGGLYRKRIAATFSLAAGSKAPLDPLSYSAEPLWSGYRDAPGPELIIAATAHSSATTFCGIKAYGFTFRSSRVTLFDRADDSSASVATDAFPSGSWWDGYPRGWLVSRSIALSGAAFASAMGREALGTTQALLVAFNLRLGAWVPNPRFAQWFADSNTSPRVHIGYLAKELLGRYHPERDAFVYVADGGHRENLGLVELLREHPDVVISIDASGDAPGSFQTLREAIALAETELDVHIEINLDSLTAANGTLPDDCVVEGKVTYPSTLGGRTGRLLYGRAQISGSAPAVLLQYAGIDRRFPHYSTADQYLTDEEYTHLISLGVHVGQRMVGLFDGVSA